MLPMAKTMAYPFQDNCSSVGLDTILGSLTRPLEVAEDLNWHCVEAEASPLGRCMLESPRVARCNCLEAAGNRRASYAGVWMDIVRVPLVGLVRQEGVAVAAAVTASVVVAPPSAAAAVAVPNRLVEGTDVRTDTVLPGASQVLARKARLRRDQDHIQEHPS